MSRPVRIEDDLCRQAKAASQRECRTIAGQLEFWARVGKAAFDNPDLPVAFVSELLLAAYSRSWWTPILPYDGQ